MDRNRHDWGYYLGTGVLTREELQLAFNALRSQATNQGDAQARRIYARLSQRLRPLNLDTQGELFYPVRSQWHHAIMHTAPEEMMEQQAHRNTLFHQLDHLEAAILQGQTIELDLNRTPSNAPTHRHIYPLQLLYHDIAWYLVMEDCANGHLAISRLDRFSHHLQPLTLPNRSLEAQHHSLNMAHHLLYNGWGLYLGDPEEQQLERQNK